VTTYLVISDVHGMSAEQKTHLIL